MTSEQWFIQMGNEAFGPMGEGELRALALRGGVQPQTLISGDRRTWVAAATVPGMTFGPACPSPPIASGMPRLTTTNGLRTDWLLGGIILGCAVAIVSGLLLLAVAGLLSPDAGPPGKVSRPIAASRGPASKQIIAERTYRYWLGVQTAMAQSAKGTASTSQAMVADLRRIVGRIRALPASDVDEDAVSCGNAIATAIGNLADYVEQSNDPAILVQAYIRGASGDPLGTAADLMDAQSALAVQLQQVQTMADNTRAVLSSRYGVEFPRL